MLKILCSTLKLNERVKIYQIYTGVKYTAAFLKAQHQLIRANRGLYLHKNAKMGVNGKEQDHISCEVLMKNKRFNKKIKGCWEREKGKYPFLSGKT